MYIYSPNITQCQEVMKKKNPEDSRERGKTNYINESANSGVQNLGIYLGSAWSCGPGEQLTVTSVHQRGVQHQGFLNFGPR
jgi:hypothetical protein